MNCPHCGKAIRIVKALAVGAQPSAPPPTSSADGSKCRKCGEREQVNTLKNPV